MNIVNWLLDHHSYGCGYSIFNAKKFICNLAVMDPLSVIELQV
jgi:hypothetical protein